MNEELSAKTAVKVALAKQDMTLTDLAGRIGTHKSTLSRVVNQDMPLGDRSLWPRIFKALGIEPVYRVE